MLKILKFIRTKYNKYAYSGKRIINFNKVLTYGDIEDIIKVNNIFKESGNEAGKKYLSV